MKKVIVITGGSKGIGLETAKYLAKKGHDLALISRSEIAAQTLNALSQFDNCVMNYIGDIGEYATAEKIVNEILDAFGKIDVLLNNAGITKDGLMMRMSETAFDDVIQTNLKGTFNMCRFVVPNMMKQKKGAIINMSSVVGIAGNAGQCNYAASKAGVIGLTKSLAKEIGSRGITVNAIAPGFIETAMTDQLSDKIKENLLDRIVLKRFGKPEEVAHVVQFLIENQYITGQTIEINGGMHI